MMGGPSSKPVVEGGDDAAQGALRQRFTAAAAAILARLDAPGLTAAILLADGSAVRIGLGLSDVERETPMRADMRMPGGSTGKSVFAATAISMALDGIIGLDDPVSRWLGDEPWFGRVPNGREMTIRSLLMHTSGLPDHMGDPATLDLFRTMRETYGSGFSLSPLHAVARVLDRSPVVPVGGGFFYTDTGYILMGLALESATGRPLYEEARKRVLEPLGLADFEPAICRQFDRLAPGYTSESPDGLMPRKTTRADGRMQLSPASEWAGGGFVTGSLSLAHFVKQYASGRAFGGAYLRDVQRIVRFSWVPNRVSGYGIGLFAMQTPLGPAWGHGGYYPGYRSDMLYFPDHDVAVAYQVNSSAKITNYPSIVASREEAAARAIAQDAPLSVVAELSVELAAAALRIALPPADAK